MNLISLFYDDLGLRNYMSKSKYDFVSFKCCLYFAILQQSVHLIILIISWIKNKLLSHFECWYRVCHFPKVILQFEHKKTVIFQFYFLIYQDTVIKDRAYWYNHHFDIQVQTLSIF